MKILLLAVLLGAAYAQFIDTTLVDSSYSSAACTNACGEGKCLDMQGLGNPACACFSGYRLDTTVGSATFGTCVAMTDCPNPSNGSTNWALSTEAPPEVIVVPAGSASPPPGSFRFVSTTAGTDLVVGYSNEIRTKREWSLGNLVHSTTVPEDTLFHAPNPINGEWTEDASNCNERHFYRGPWATVVDTANNGNAGFDGPIPDTNSQYEAGSDTYLSYLVVREREEAADFRGTTIYRHITHAFPLKIKLKNTVTVDDDVNIFAPVNVLAALTESTIVPKATDPTKVEVKFVIRTQVQAPFYLRQVSTLPGVTDFGPYADSNTPNDLDIVPAISAGSPKFTVPTQVSLSHTRDGNCQAEHTSGLADFQAGLVLCDQTFTIEFELSIVDATGANINCEADGLYKLYTRARCRDELNAQYFDTLNAGGTDPAIGCPIIDTSASVETTQWDGQIDVNIDTADYCNKYEISVELDGTLGVFEEAARTTPRDDFFLNTEIYFRAHLYSTDTAITLSSVTLKSIDVTGPVNGGTQSLWPGATDTVASTCGQQWNVAIQGGSTISTQAGSYTDPSTGTAYTTIRFDFEYTANPENDVTYSVNGIPSTLVGIGSCGMDIATDENKVLGTTVEFSVQYTGTPSSRTTHLTIGQGEEAALLSVSRQAADGGDSATNQQATEFVVSVPRGEDNTQTPGAINTGSSKDAASTLSSFLF